MMDSTVDFMVELLRIWSEGLQCLYDAMHETTVLGMGLDFIVGVLIFMAVMLPALRWIIFGGGKYG